MRFLAEKKKCNPRDLNNHDIPVNQEVKTDNCELPEAISYGNKIVYSNFDDIMREMSHPDLFHSLKKCLAIKDTYKSVLPQFKRCPRRSIINYHNQRKYLSRYYPNLLYFLETEFDTQSGEPVCERVSPEVIMNRVDIKLNDLTYLSEIVNNKIKSIKEQMDLNDLSRSNQSEAHGVNFGGNVPQRGKAKSSRVGKVPHGKCEPKGFVKTLSVFRAGLFIKIIDYIEKNECTEAHACRQVCKMKKYSNEDPNLTRKLFNAHKNNHDGTLEGLREFLNSVEG